MLTLALKLLQLLIPIILGSSQYKTIEQKVIEYSSKQISSALKRKGVLDDIQTLYPDFNESKIRLGIEIAVANIKSRLF